MYKMTYIFDGTEDGFLTAFLQAFFDEDALLCSKPAQLYLGQTPVFVQTHAKKAEKARARLRHIDARCIKEMQFLLCSGEEGSEQAAFLYLRLVAKTGKPVRGQLSQPAVFDALSRVRRVQLEIHRFHGFIRFMQTQSGALYAPFSPDHDVCAFLAPHFISRLYRCAFVLHDVRRKKAAVYDGERVFCAPLEAAEVVLDGDELAWMQLWKRYYNAVNIPSRQRLSQMRGYMPKRYWTFLPERQEK